MQTCVQLVCVNIDSATIWQVLCIFSKHYNVAKELVFVYTCISPVWTSICCVGSWEGVDYLQVILFNVLTETHAWYIRCSFVTACTYYTKTSSEACRRWASLLRHSFDSGPSTALWWLWFNDRCNCLALSGDYFDTEANCYSCCWIIYIAFSGLRQNNSLF